MRRALSVDVCFWDLAVSRMMSVDEDRLSEKQVELRAMIAFEEFRITNLYYGLTKIDRFGE